MDPSTPGVSHPLDLNESTVLADTSDGDVVMTLRPRTLANPFVTDSPPVCPGIKTSDALKGSALVPSKIFTLETPDKVMDEYVLPIDDVIDPNKYVGDWEELYIRFYHRVFSLNEHVMYWGKSEIGNFVVCVGRAHPEMGFPTLSLGPNGFHFARLSADETDREFPLPKQLNRLFPHFEECKFVYAKEVDKLSLELSSFEQKMKPTRYKFGILYMREGQTEENDIYGNLDPSQEFVDFLKLMGDIVELQNHKGYRGGLDCSGGNTTGELACYTTVFLADGTYIPRGKDAPPSVQEDVILEVMFHVAPFLPYSSGNEGNQQLHKKRHLGNDICVVIFKEGTSKLSPDIFKSQFNHVYIVVTPVSESGTGKPTHYKVEVLSKGLKGFAPQLPQPPLLPIGEAADWILLKLINGEVASMNGKDLRLKMKRTRVQTLDSWAKTHLGDRHESHPPIVNRKKQ